MKPITLQKLKSRRLEKSSALILIFVFTFGSVNSFAVDLTLDPNNGAQVPAKPYDPSVSTIAASQTQNTSEAYPSTTPTTQTSNQFLATNPLSRVSASAFSEFDSPGVTVNTYNPSLLTILSGSPTVTGSSGSTKDYNRDASIELTQNSNHGFNFNYNLPDEFDFAFAFMLFNTPQNLGTNPTLALSGPEGKQLKVEFKDNFGRDAVFYINLTGEIQNYTFSLNGNNFPDGFNASQIYSMAIVADNRTGSSGTVTVETKGLYYAPVISGDSYNPSVITALPGSPTFFTGKGDSNSDNNSVITQTQTSSSEFKFDYQLPDREDFVFSGVQFSTPQSLGLVPVFAINGPAGKRLKVEFKDVNGSVAVSYLNLAGVKQNYILSLSPDIVPLGFNPDKINEIVFVVEQEYWLEAGKSGTIQVETKGLYVPFIPVTPVATSIWGIPGNPAITYVAPAGAEIREGTEIPGDGTGAAVIHLEFQTHDAGWAGGGLSYDNFQTSEIETTDFSQMDYSSFGLMADAEQIKFEVVDAQGRKAVFYLDTTPHQTATFRIETNKLRDQGIDVTQVRLLYFIVEGQNLSGDIVVNYGSTQSSLEALGQIFDSSQLIPGQNDYAYLTSRLDHCAHGYCSALWLENLRTGRINRVAPFIFGYPIPLSTISPKNTAGGQVMIAQILGPGSYGYQIHIARVNNMQEEIIITDVITFDPPLLERVQFTGNFAILYRHNQPTVWVDLKTFQQIEPVLPPGDWTQVADNPDFFYQIVLDENGSPKAMAFFDTRSGQLFSDEGDSIFGYITESQLRSVSVPQNGKFAAFNFTIPGRDGQTTRYFHFESHSSGGTAVSNSNFAVGSKGIINLETGELYPLMGYREKVWAYAYDVSPDGQWGAYFYGNLRPDSTEQLVGLWNIKTGQKIELRMDYNSPDRMNTQIWSNPPALPLGDWRQTGNLSFFFQVEYMSIPNSAAVQTKIKFFDTQTGRTVETVYDGRLEIRFVSTSQQGKFAAIELFDKDGKIETRYFHFETKASGSVFAPSNPNFVFASYDNGIGNNYVLDLKTGNAYSIGQCSNSACFSPVDVSPDGQWIISNYSAPAPFLFQTNFLNIKTGQQMSSDQLSGLKFLPDGNMTGIRTTQLPHFPYDESIRENVLIDLKKGQVIVISYSYKGQVNPAFLRNNFLLLRSVYDEFLIFDVSQGLDRMSLAYRSRFFGKTSSDGVVPTNIDYFDAQRGGGGKAVFAVSYTYQGAGNTSYSKTMIIASWKTTPWVLKGKVKKIQKIGHRLIYVLSTGQRFEVEGL